MTRRILAGLAAIVACGGAPSAATGDAAPGTTTAAVVTTGAATTSAASSGAAGPETSAASTSAATTAASTSAASTGDASTSAALRPDLPPPCVPTTCVDAGKTCGEVPDECGGVLACGRCEAPDTCGGGGVDGVCGRPCAPVRAIFFDLGDTLVMAEGDLFVERPGVPEMLVELAGLGVRLGVVTNTPEDWTRQDLEALLVDPDLLDAFEVVLLSSEAAASPKPDPAIFVEAHGLMLDAPPIAAVAYVSENLAEIADQEPPTQGARAAGMLGVHLSSAPASPLADVTLAPEQPEALVELAETEWLPCRGP